MRCENLPAEVFEPEFVVGILEMITLIAVIAVHSVWVDHKIELLAGSVHCIKELEGILMVDIVITGAVCKLQHYRLDRLPRRCRSSQ